jgi:membrane associated rhomboid family serine protease
MARFTEEFLLRLLQACADCEPAPLYPTRFAKEHNLDRDELDQGLDELRRRGLVKLTDWVKDHGQGRALTEAGHDALKRRHPAPAPAETAATENAAEDETGDYGRGEVVRRAIFEPRPAYVTRVLLAANILYFLFGAAYAGWNGWDVPEYLAGDPPSIDHVLRALGALHPALVFNFLHVGFLHLAMNMYFLGTIARQIESMWGSLRFFVIYAVSGLVSGCIVLLIASLETQMGMTAGASGCLYGVFVSMVVWFALNHHYLPENVVQAFSGNLATNVVLLVLINFWPGISWQGHFGGAVGGLLAALLLHVQRFHPVGAVRVLALLAVPLVPAGFFVAVLWQAGRLF